MILDLEVQNATEMEAVPSESTLTEWIKAAIRDEREEAEVVIRLVDEEEIHDLNREYRGKDKSTNVLSFPSILPTVVNSNLLGDIIICGPVVWREAQEQGKIVDAHWAHMVVHGVLHLLGYDHQEDSDGDSMEKLEKEIMAGLGFLNPYEEGMHE